MYISFHKLHLPGMAYLMIHLMTSLTPEFPELLERYLLERLEPESDIYDPMFPWNSARLILLYHGPQELPDGGRITLPGGRVVQMININPGHSGKVPASLDDYIQAMEVGRQALLTGKTPLEAAVRLWTHCVQNGTMHTMTSSEENFQCVIEDMERLQSALAEDLSVTLSK